MELEQNAVDLVVPWVNGNDSTWMEQYRNYLDKAGEPFRMHYYKTRFLPNDDLQVLLRSVSTHAPSFFRRIWIVHDPLHTPPVDSRLITLVSHDQFIPQEYLPTFSSIAIQSFLHLIPGLSDKFIVMDDDMYFTGRPSLVDFFWGSKPLVFMKSMDGVYDQKEGEISRWGIALRNSNAMLNRKFYPDIAAHLIRRQRADHYAKAFTKKIFTETWRLFRPELEEHARERCRLTAIRNGNALEFVTMLASWVSLELGLAVPARTPLTLLSYNPDTEDHPNYRKGHELYTQPCEFEL